jgi:hypothetical protein
MPENVTVGSTSPIEQRVLELHDNAVKRLVEAHQQLEEPLLLALRYEGDDPADVCLLEVLETFPGDEDDELFTTKYESSASLRIVGELHLTLGSPAQLRAAVRRGDPLIAKLAGAKIVFVDHSKSEAEQLLVELGLRS